MSTEYDDEFDPLADEEEDEEALTVIGAQLEPEAPQAIDTRTPRERLDDLIESLPGQKRVLMGILAFCREPRSSDAVDARTLELKEHNYSIYSPVNIRELLEKTGTLEYVPAPAPDEQPAITEEVLSDGENEYELEYLEVQEKPQGTWVTTAAGIELVDEQDPEGALKQLLADDLPFLGVYKRILLFCNEEGGKNIKQIDALIKDEPLLQNPRKYGGYFVERLEACEALLWKGTWVTSPTGAAAIAEAARIEAPSEQS